jgi:hypothetical protein
MDACLQASGGVQGHFPQPAVLVHTKISTTFRFFFFQTLNWHVLDRLFYIHACLDSTCSLVECSDICNLLKDGEDDQ